MLCDYFIFFTYCKIYDKTLLHESHELLPNLFLHIVIGFFYYNKIWKRFISSLIFTNVLKNLTTNPHTSPAPPPHISGFITGICLAVKQDSREIEWCLFPVISSHRYPAAVYLFVLAEYFHIVLILDCMLCLPDTSLCYRILAYVTGCLFIMLNIVFLILVDTCFLCWILICLWCL